VLEVKSIGWVSVKWDKGNSNSYRMGQDDAQDLEVIVVEGGAPPGAGVDDSDVVPQRMPLPSSVEEKIDSLFASGRFKLRYGERVVRGRDWAHGADDDGGLGGVGLVMEPKEGETVEAGYVQVSI